MKGNF